MIQFYAQSQPDRAKALSYFEAMVKARVQPTAHTYKLLLDLYGSLQPVDLPSLKDVFARLQQERYVSVEAVHWASLINSYGIAQSNVNEAVNVFNSIATHTSSQQSGSPSLPDAVCYEALLNVFLHNNMPERVEEYVQKMHASNVHATAYIANVRIQVCLESAPSS